MEKVHKLEQTAYATCKPCLKYVPSFKVGASGRETTPRLNVVD